MYQIRSLYLQRVLLLALAVSGFYPTNANADGGTGMLASLLGSEVVALVTGSTASSSAMGSGLGQMMLNLTSVVLLVAGALLAYSLVRRWIATAQSGQFLGDKNDSVWFTLKTVYTAVLLLPLPSGVVVAQLFVVWLAIQGSNIANGVWSVAKSTSVGTAMFSPKANAAQPTTMMVHEGATKAQVVALSEMITGAESRDRAAMTQLRYEQERSEFDRRNTADAGLPAIADPANQAARLRDVQIRETPKGIIIGLTARAAVDNPNQLANDGIGFIFNWISDRPEDIAFQRQKIKELFLEVINVGKTSSAAQLSDGLASRDFLDRREARLSRAVETYLKSLDDIATKKHDRAISQFQTAFENGEYWQNFEFNDSPSTALKELPVKASATSIKAVSTTTGDWIGLGGIYMASHATVAQTRSRFTQNIISDVGTAAGETVNYLQPGGGLWSLIMSNLSGSTLESLKRLLSPEHVQEEAFKSFRSLANSAARTSAAGGNPMAMLQATGQALVETMSTVWMSLTMLKAVADGVAVGLQAQSVVTAALSVAPILGGIAATGSSFIGSIMDIVRPLSIAGYIAGFGLALYVPAIPFLIWMGMLVAWMVVVFEAFVAVVPWAAMHLLGDEDSMAPSRTHNGYAMLFALLLRPAIYVLSFHAAAAIFQVAAGLANGVFPAFTQTVQFNSLTSIVWVIALLVLYFAIMVAIVNLAFDAAPAIADRILRWIGADSPSFNAEGRSHAVFAAGVGRFYGGGGGGRGGARAPAPRQAQSSSAKSGGRREDSNAERASEGLFGSGGKRGGSEGGVSGHIHAASSPSSSAGETRAYSTRSTDSGKRVSSNSSSTQSGGAARAGRSETDAAPHNTNSKQSGHVQASASSKSEPTGLAATPNAPRPPLRPSVQGADAPQGSSFRFSSFGVKSGDQNQPPPPSSNPSGIQSAHTRDDAK